MSNQRLSKRIFNICMVCVMIVVIIFIAMMLMLNYNVNGESNMPFSISKISIISTVNGQRVDNNDAKWALDAIENNDIYIYIEKNDNYTKQEMISSIELNNFNIIKSPDRGNLKFYKPTIDTASLFKNSNDLEFDKIIFKGASSTDTRKLEISNQGGTLAFRCAINDIGTYISNEEDELNYSHLLNKLNVNYDNLYSQISFDMLITLHSKKIFKAENIVIELPNDGIVSNGTVGKENLIFNEIVFKRVEK